MNTTSTSRSFMKVNPSSCPRNVPAILRYLSQKWGSDDWRVISFVAMRIVWKLLPAQLGRPSSCTSTIDNIVAVAGEHQAHPMRSGSGPPFIEVGEGHNCGAQRRLV